MSRIVCIRHPKGYRACPVPRCDFAFVEWHEVKAKDVMREHLDDKHPELVRG